jgi:hypothetical protein
LADYSQPSPAIDGTKFPSTVTAEYWSSTPYAASPTFAWWVRFSDGKVSNSNKNNPFYVRCVSGASKESSSGSFTDNNDGTVKDNATGLIWQKCSKGQTGADCSGGSATAATWTTALTDCSGLTLAGRTWRLPTVNELGSLLDTTKASGPTIDTTAFPSTVANYYWSSTTYAPNTSNVWAVLFFDGLIPSNFSKTTNSYVRCVTKY